MPYKMHHLLKIFLIITSLNCGAFEYFQMGGVVTQRDQTSENLNLFLAQYLTLGGKIDKEYFIEGMNQRRLPSGLYKRSPIHNSRTVSQDEILGFMISSKILGTNHRKEIWNQIVSNYGAYPAIINTWTDLIPFNAGNYYPWCLISDADFPCEIYAPVYIINTFINANRAKESTSSKILTWLELANMPINEVNIKLTVYFDKKMTEQYGKKWLSELLHIYHNQEDESFPIFIEVANADKR